MLPDSINYWEAFAGGDVRIQFTVTVVVGRTAERASQKSLYAFMSYSGDKSVRAAIEADRTLGGVAQTSIVQSADNIRVVSQGDADYLALDFNVMVHG